jgi:hypothetical protein
MILRLIAIILCLLLVGVSVYVTVVPPPEEMLPAKRAVPIRTEIAEGLKVGRAGIYGIDLISCDRVGIEKRERGPFAFGGFNVLVLDNLKVVLPQGAQKDSVDENVERVDAASVLRDIGVSQNFLQSNGIRRRFSGLKVNGLELSRLDNATNVVRLLMAQKGEFKRVGLELKDLIVSRMNGDERISNAVLKKEHGVLKLVWSYGEMEL